MPEERDKPTLLKYFEEVRGRHAVAKANDTNLIDAVPDGEFREIEALTQHADPEISAAATDIYSLLM